MSGLTIIPEMVLPLLMYEFYRPSLYALPVYFPFCPYYCWVYLNALVVSELSLTWFCSFYSWSFLKFSFICFAINSFKALYFLLADLWKGLKGISRLCWSSSSNQLSWWFACRWCNSACFTCFSIYWVVPSTLFVGPSWNKHEQH